MPEIALSRVTFERKFRQVWGPKDLDLCYWQYLWGFRSGAWELNPKLSVITPISCSRFIILTRNVRELLRSSEIFCSRRNCTRHSVLGLICPLNLCIMVSWSSRAAKFAHDQWWDHRGPQRPTKHQTPLIHHHKSHVRNRTPNQRRWLWCPLGPSGSRGNPPTTSSIIGAQRSDGEDNATAGYWSLAGDSSAAKGNGTSPRQTRLPIFHSRLPTEAWRQKRCDETHRLGSFEEKNERAVVRGQTLDSIKIFTKS
jgi:hypothetical protein